MTNIPITLFIVDDHQMLIDGIKALLFNESDFKIEGEALRCTDALEALKKKRPDILITDINMPEMSGIEFANAVRRTNPDQKILALSMAGEKATITDMLDTGVKGYILKNTGKKELLIALKKIANGETYFSPDVAEEMNRSDETIDKRYILTAREREIVRYVAQGLSHTEIGEKIFISPRTVDTHRTNIMRKLEVHSIAELIKLAIQLKLIE
jgi:two-component system, NarL family, nitrate/nitrite response regulator NarL